MGVARNVVIDPKLVPGGGAVELSVAAEIKEKAEAIEGVEQVTFRRKASCLCKVW